MILNQSLPVHLEIKEKFFSLFSYFLFDSFARMIKTTNFPTIRFYILNTADEY